MYWNIHCFWHITFCLEYQMVTRTKKVNNDSKSVDVAYVHFVFLILALFPDTFWTAQIAMNEWMNEWWIERDVEVVMPCFNLKLSKWLKINFPLHRTDCSIKNTQLLMLLRKIMLIYFYYDKKPIKTSCGQNVNSSRNVRVNLSCFMTRASLDISTNRKISCPFWGLNCIPWVSTL